MIVLRNDEKARLGATGVDAFGKPAPLENVVFESSDPNIIKVLFDDVAQAFYASTTGEVTAEGATVQLRVSADARIGEGEVALTGEESMQVLPSEARSMTIAFGAPEKRI